MLTFDLLPSLSLPLSQANFFDLLGSGIFNSDGDTWQQQRKTASHEFSARSLRDFMVAVIQEEVNTRLLPTLKQVRAAGPTLSIQPILSRLERVRFQQ